MPDTAPDTAPDTVHHIPLAEIDPEALPRDRTCLINPDMAELKNSIATSGLRMPIEIFPLETREERPDAAPDAAPDGTPDAAPGATPDAPPRRYGLVSGYRRYHALREMHETEVEAGIGPPRFATIPAFIRPRAGRVEQLVAVVEENAIRSALSPWEQGHIACHAWHRGVFETLDEAVSKLYRSADRMKRSRLRAIAQVVEELDGILTTPEMLNQRQLLRISRAIDAEFGDVIRVTLEESSRTSAEAQWELILPYLLEAEQPPLPDAPKPRPGYPRRVARIQKDLTIRRQWTQDGWILHFTGKEAHGFLINDIMDEIQRLYGR